MKPPPDPIRERSVRIAFAGCGRIASKHIASILQNHAWLAWWASVILCPSGLRRPRAS